MDLIWSSLLELTGGFIVSQLAMGAILGFLIGMTGIGAGVLIMPALLFVSHTDPAMAVGTSLLFSVLSKGYGVFEHWKLGSIDVETNLAFSIGAVPMVLLSSIGVNILKASMPPDTFDFYMKAALAVMVFLICIYLFWDAFKKNQSDLYKCGDPLTAKQKTTGALFGGGIGALVGGTSIGGGVFIIPILAGVFKLSAKCVVGTSTIISVMLTLVGAGVYLYYGNVNLAIALLLVVGSLPGIKLGVAMAHKLPNLVLKRVMAGLAFISFVSMVTGIKSH
ncbi:MAG: sulfite exporter TauE/SafE family protein [Nitrospinae bacterium]|nr:sulfite exporter TauE/SafE family protein [Nitrospinota bacterium]